MLSNLATTKTFGNPAPPSGPRVARFGEISRQQVSLGGGKGANLSELVRAGFPVPPGFIVCAPAFSAAIEGGGLRSQIDAIVAHTAYDQGESLAQASGAIKKLVRSLTLLPDLEAEIRAAYRELGQGQPVPVAVRSSATAEDLSDASFAGQQETFLFVMGEEDLLYHIKECWASLYNSRALFYRHRRGFSEDEVSMAVVVQQMVDADKAGVLFTANPITKDQSSMVIEASWGLGEAVVSGLVTPDNYMVDKGSGEIRYQVISIKKKMIVRREGHKGTIEKDVALEKRVAQVLDQGEIQALAELGRKLEAYMGFPQDIEWAIKGDRAYLLQSRPITTL